MWLRKNLLGITVLRGQVLAAQLLELIRPIFAEAAAGHGVPLLGAVRVDAEEAAAQAGGVDGPHSALEVLSVGDRTFMVS